MPTTSTFPSPNPRSKAQQRTSVQPAKVARQLKSRNPALRAPWPRPGSWNPGSLRAPRQLESWNLTVQAPRQLKSWNLSILSFYRGSTRLQQPATARHRPPQAGQLSVPGTFPGLTFSPKTITKTMRKLRAWKADPKVENEWPETQSAHACAVQTHLVTFRKNSKYHRKCAHFGSPFRSFWVPFSRLSPTSGPRAPGPRPKVGTR